jgi:hypothetical protein
MGARLRIICGSMRIDADHRFLAKLDFFSLRLTNFP